MEPRLSVSVGICAHNEAATIGRLLDQVMAESLVYDAVYVVAAGDDGTKEIVAEKAEEYGPVELVVEEERRGQSAAQDRILSRNDSDVVLLVDGDGVIRPGSLELLVERYDGSSLLYGREVPMTGSSLTGRVISAFWRLHHRMSLERPKYTTQIALLPSNVLERIPHVVVADDEYIGVTAVDQGYGIEYVPEAVKYHRVKPDIGSFMRHSRKNWVGLMQVGAYGAEVNLQPSWFKAGFVIDDLVWEAPLWEKPVLLLVGVVETLTFVQGWLWHLCDRYPAIWER